jgi:hypothetical protein
MEIVTKKEFQEFEKKLFDKLEEINSKLSVKSSKEILKSDEVQALLKISPGTLQNLRKNGTIRFTKIGGTIFYNSEDIYSSLNQ